MNKETYYSIAIFDLKYLQATLHLPYYNNIAIGAQQVTEKMLKSVAEMVCVNPEKLLKSHNLRSIANHIYEDEGIEFNEEQMAYLKDFYFDARYPGEDYINVSKEQCNKCLQIMYDVIDIVHQFRERCGLLVENYDKCYIFEPTILTTMNYKDSEDLKTDEIQEESCSFETQNTDIELEDIDMDNI